MDRDLQSIPGVGPNLEAHLNALGIHTVAELNGADPEELYRRDCALHGGSLDRCCLYVYRLAVAWAEGRVVRPEQRSWWYWKDQKEDAP